MIMGHDEPWDAEGRYYFYALLAAGFVSSLFLARAFWVAPIGVFVGQLLFCIYLAEPDGVALWPLGMIVAILYCSVALVGGLAGAVFTWIVSIVLGIVRLFKTWKRPKKAAI